VQVYVKFTPKNRERLRKIYLKNRVYAFAKSTSVKFVSNFLRGHGSLTCYLLLQEGEVYRKIFWEKDASWREIYSETKGAKLRETYVDTKRAQC
jgi:hypothetical protein